MIKVGFYTEFSNEWLGGIVYLKNLIFAITSHTTQIEPIIMCPEIPKETDISHLFQNTTVYQDIRFKEKFYATLLEASKKLGIKLISHQFLYGDHHPFKVVGWIPDFQHKHLPQMFSEEERLERERRFLDASKASNTMILSSNHALNDFRKSFPEYVSKGKVLHFVAQIDAIYRNISYEHISKKYDIRSEYFFLPNQFWKHKNHHTVFKAIRELKNTDILLLCSGHLNDYRHRDHIQTLTHFIQDNGLENNIRLLGTIPLEDVHALMHHASSVINPSLFEGWSTTVEECKSMGKPMILSDIEVHREQNPPVSDYFRPDDFQGLADLLKKHTKTKKAIPNPNIESLIKHNQHRTRAFYKNYETIVLETLDA